MISSLDLLDAKRRWNEKIRWSKKDKELYKLYPSLSKNKIYTIYVPNPKSSTVPLKINFGYPSDFVRRADLFQKLRWRAAMEKNFPESLQNETKPLFWTYNLIYNDEDDINKALADFLKKRNGNELTTLKI